MQFHSLKKCVLIPLNKKKKVYSEKDCTFMIIFFFVEPLVYFAFLFFNETVITKTQGLVVAIAKREYINKSK